MPEFASALTMLPKERKLSHEDLVRAVRFMVAAEYEAVQIYMQVAESTDNELAQAVLKDVSEEELIHAGEFLHLLNQLEPSEQQCYARGADEVKATMAKIGKR